MQASKATSKSYLIIFLGTKILKYEPYILIQNYFVDMRDVPCQPSHEITLRIVNRKSSGLICMLNLNENEGVRIN